LRPAGIGGAIVPITPSHTDTWFRRLTEAIGDRRIVLLGENGHGVAEFTVEKARLVQLLHERMGYDVVAFESPFYDCELARRRLEANDIVGAARNCLISQLQHADIRSLFDYLAAPTHARSLEFSGVDLQIMLFGARTRPAHLRAELPGIGERLAPLDSALIERTFLGADSVRAWVRANGESTRALLDSAAARASGQLAWILRTDAALLDRLMLQGTGAGGTSPVRYYELRDEWMARTIGWLADSTGSARKVVVWLHNDHARYGSWQTPSGPARATGQFLRNWYGDRVFSIGYLMGRGQIADNSRRTRDMIPIPTGSIEEAFRNAGHAKALMLVRDAGAWAQIARPYMRAGLAIDTLTVAREFDAVIYVDSVKPAVFGIR
jgi:erythromycin esterase